MFTMNPVVAAVAVSIVIRCTATSAEELERTKVAGGLADRAYTVQTLTRIAEPVLTALSENKLKECLPKSEWEAARKSYAPLEATGRLLAGMAPWLELGPDQTEEGKLRARYIDLAVKGIANAVNPAAADFMNFTNGSQPLVDAAFLAHALLRAPKQLWGNLGDDTRFQTLSALKATRRIKPGNNNWLLFSAIIETALWNFSGECQTNAIELAVNRHMEWYKGDGVYGDGPEFHWDYYNSYVMQPMLLEVLRVAAQKHHALGAKYPLVLERARRYAAIQERLISPEGTFPVIGRSSAYRFGAFQLLSQVALWHELAPDLKPAAVRCALSAVVQRMIEAPGTFDENGWLRVGAVGFQPSIREPYISTGSLYLCAAGLLQLGLPPEDPFWIEPPMPWTQKRIWSGEDVKADHAVR
jgi:hypothetical protein